MESLKSRWLGSGVVLVVVIVVVCLRVGWSGMSSLDAGQHALAAGDEVGATAKLREALGWYLPVAPWRTAAAEDLWGLYETQAARGDLPSAVTTLSALRSGVLAGHGLFRPDGDLLERVHGVLPGLMARWEVDAARSEGRREPGPLGDREAHFSGVLERDVRPGRGWGFLAALGFLLWIGAALYATGHEGRARIQALAASAAGLALFLVGLGFA
jgi:hypothetical protein